MNINILFWDNPKTGLTLYAQRINSNSAHIVEKSIYSDKSKKLQELLVKARKDSGMTQQGLADKLGKHQSFVAKYEGGERRLDMVEFIDICYLLNKCVFSYGLFLENILRHHEKIQPKRL